MPKLNISPWKRHVAKWSNCDRCLLCDGRKHVVLARGKIPADILFVGEAPGESEDVIGSPFVGPAGMLLDQICERAGCGEWRCCWTNLVACIPRDGVNKASEPPVEAIKACRPRLEELMAMVEPQLIVRVGGLSAKYCDPNLARQSIDITHPAAILRADEARKGLMIQRVEAALVAAVSELIPF